MVLTKFATFISKSSGDEDFNTKLNNLIKESENKKVEPTVENNILEDGQVIPSSAEPATQQNGQQKPEVQNAAPEKPPEQRKVSSEVGEKKYRDDYKRFDNSKRDPERDKNKDYRRKDRYDQPERQQSSYFAKDSKGGVRKREDYYRDHDGPRREDYGKHHDRSNARAHEDKNNRR